MKTASFLTLPLLALFIQQPAFAQTEIDLSGSFADIQAKMHDLGAKIIAEQPDNKIVAQKGSVCLTYLFADGTLHEVLNAKSHESRNEADQTFASYKQFLAGKGSVVEESPTKLTAKTGSQSYSLELVAIGSMNVDVKMKVVYGN